MPTKEVLKQHQLVRVTFELPPDVQGSVVHLVGDFTGWEGVPMKRSDEGGWTTTVDLAPGRSFEFRYLVDGERWENDWNADRYVRSPFGHDNSVVDTPALDAPEAMVEHGAAGKSPASGAADPSTSRNAEAMQPTAKDGGTTAGASANAAAPRKPAAKKSAAGKTATKSPAAKKTTAREAAAKKPATKTATKKAAARKPAAKKTTAGEAAAKKPAAKRSAAGKTPAKGAAHDGATKGTAGTTPQDGGSTTRSMPRESSAERGSPRSAPEEAGRSERRDDSSGSR